MEKMLHGVLVIIVVSLLTFVSCVPENDVPGVANSNGTSGLNGTEQGSWNNDLVNTAATSTYMSALEQQVIFEMNKARTNPALYAQLYIEPMLAHFSGKIFNWLRL